MRTDGDGMPATPVRGRRNRRRGVAATAAAAVALVAAVGGGALLRPSGGGEWADGDVSEGRRLVGIGHAAIAVPEGWGTNATYCGVPKGDTVVLDVGSVCLGGSARPPGVESVELLDHEPSWEDGVPVSDVDVAGEPARRSATTCSDGPSGVCRAAVHLPRHGVAFVAESSTGRAEVEEILTWIRIVDDRVAVPGPRRISELHQGDGEVAYLGALRRAGLAAEVVRLKMPGMTPGFLLRAVPEAGAMLAPGETVTVSVVAPPEGPAEEVRVGVGYRTAGSPPSPFLDDAQLRAGARLDLAVGDSVWAFASGTRGRAMTLAGTIDGHSLAVRRSGAKPGHAWLAVRPGTTTLTLTVDDEEGRRVRAGALTVVVRRGSDAPSTWRTSAGGTRR